MVMHDVGNILEDTFLCLIALSILNLIYLLWMKQMREKEQEK